MFEYFRKHTRLLMVVLFLLVIPSFVLLGIDQYSDGSRAGGQEVARVDGQAITRPEWDARHRLETDRIRSQMRDIDPALLDSEQARYRTLEAMVRERVLLTAAEKGHLSVSDERVIRSAEERGLSSFRGADGKLDSQRFMLATGLTPQQFEASIRSELAMQQLIAGVAGTPLAAQAQADLALDAIYAGREIQVARFDAADFSSKVTLTDDDLQRHYQAHAGRWRAPEQASIEYVLLDSEAAKRNVTVSEADLRSYYEQNKARFGSAEERRASHILIAAAAGAAPGERDKARARAEELLTEVRKNPGSFTELARKHSQDPGSAQQGGALDMVPRGALVKPFEDAMFALGKGEISPVVESDFGYHIIRLDEIKEAQVPPFEQVRAQVESEARTQQASQEFAKAAEALTELAYQNTESLKPVAEALKLEIRTANGVGRTPAPGVSGPLGSRSFVAALYESEVLEGKQNTAPIDIGANQLVVGRVLRHTPARALPLDEVKQAVREQLTAERAAALAREEGAARLAQWEKSADKDAAKSVEKDAAARLGPVLKASRVDPQGQPEAVIEAALRADRGKLPVWVGVDLGTQGYAVIRVNKDLPRLPSEAAIQAQERSQLGRAVAAAEADAYYKLLSDRLKARILVPRPAQTESPQPEQS